MSNLVPAEFGYNTLTLIMCGSSISSGSIPRGHSASLRVRPRANNWVLQAATALTAEVFTRDLGASFCSARDTLVHIIGGEWIWLSYWRRPPLSPDELTNLRARRDALFNPQEFPNVATVRLMWLEIE